MTPNKRELISKLESKLGLEDETLDQLKEVLLDEERKLADYKEAVIDTVSEFHNDKKDLKTVIEELITVLSAAREYDNDRTTYTEKQRNLLWDTGSEVLIKALKILNKN